MFFNNHIKFLNVSLIFFPCIKNYPTSIFPNKVFCHRFNYLWRLFFLYFQTIFTYCVFVCPTSRFLQCIQHHTVLCLSIYHISSLLKTTLHWFHIIIFLYFHNGPVTPTSSYLYPSPCYVLLYSVSICGGKAPFPDRDHLVSPSSLFQATAYSISW